MISVVIPLYNKKKSIANTLQTVLRQTFQLFEIVIVDDGSTDNSIQEVYKIRDSRIRIISQVNSGVSAARNRGIHEAKYDLIAFLDADDEWKKEYLETQYNLYLKYPECNVYACGYEIHSSNGNIIHTIIRKLPFQEKDGELTNYFEVASCSHPPLWTSAVVVNKKAIKSIGGFPVGIKSGEDLLTWARLAAKYRIAYSKEVQAVFVGSKSSSNISKPQERLSKEDEVLIGLSQLYDIIENKNDKKQLKRFIFRWYKIQCVILLEVDKGYECVKKAVEAIFKGGRLDVFIALIVLGILPMDLAMYLLGRTERK